MPQAKRYRFEFHLRELARIGRIIGHPARIVLLESLRTNGLQTFQQLSYKIPLSKQTVSRHLQELIKSQLVIYADRSDGTTAYRINGEADEELRWLLKSFAA